LIGPDSEDRDGRDLSLNSAERPTPTVTPFGVPAFTSGKNI